MMFTGIIEEIGTVTNIIKNAHGLEITISGEKIFDDLKIGDSVSVNGCCQTVTKISNKTFTVQAVFETVKLTNFKNLTINSQVNLERAVTPTTRLGGHIVSGHIDESGEIIRIQNVGNSVVFEVQANKNIMKYIIYKGSISINGISLTVCEVNENSFKVSVIPHTIENTTLKNAKVNDLVNLEPDVIAKYVEKMVHKSDNNSKSNITLEFLKENGF